MARKNPETPEAAETTETVEGSPSFPANRRTNAEQGALFEKWKEQGRVKCAQPKCHWPLNLVKPAENNRQPVDMETDEGPALEAVCSWDPGHERPEGGKQYILRETLAEQEKKDRGE